VGCKVDDEQRAVGPQRARRLEDGRSGVVEEVQDMMEHGEIDALRFDIEVIHVALTHRAVRQPSLIEAATGDVQHLPAQIDADAAGDAIGEQLEDSARTGADVEQVVDREIGDGVEEGSLYDLVGPYLTSVHTHAMEQPDVWRYYQEFFRRLARDGYTGYVSNECAYQGPDPEKVLRLYTTLFQSFTS